jgi:hypothetical protein
MPSANQTFACHGSSENETPLQISRRFTTQGGKDPIPYQIF